MIEFLIAALGSAFRFLAATTASVINTITSQFVIVFLLTVIIAAFVALAARTTKSH